MTASPIMIAISSPTDPVAKAIGLDINTLAQFAARSFCTSPAALQLSVQPLRGGLQSLAVARVSASTRPAAGQRRTFNFVVKRLDCGRSYEAGLYAGLLQPAAVTLAPRFLGCDELVDGSWYLYLEYVRAARAWPWRDVNLAAALLSDLADFHRTPHADEVSGGPNWDYETELHRSAEATLLISERLLLAGRPDAVRSARRSIRRMTAALPAIRRVLLHNSRLGRCLLHGDVHSGNVVVRDTGGNLRPILVDWGRARLGSPLEDVNSWLQSLGFWEPEAKRRHDWLFRHYLRARGHADALDRELRDLYWLAGACNALAGALRYHLVVTANEELPPRRRLLALQAARDHLRVIRRADVVWSA